MKLLLMILPFPSLNLRSLPVTLFLALSSYLFASLSCAFGLGQPRYVETRFSPGCFTIVDDAGVATLFVDTNDFPGVVRAVGDLQTDISRVTTRKLLLTHAQSTLGTN